MSFTRLVDDVSVPGALAGFLKSERAWTEVLNDPTGDLSLFLVYFARHPRALKVACEGELPEDNDTTEIARCVRFFYAVSDVGEEFPVFASRLSGRLQRVNIDKVSISDFHKFYEPSTI